MAFEATTVTDRSTHRKRILLALGASVVLGSCGASEGARAEAESPEIQQPRTRREIVAPVGQRLEGRWRIHLTLRDSTPPSPSPRPREARGALWFSNDFDDFPAWVEEIDRDTPYAVGRYQIDLGSLLSGTDSATTAKGRREWLEALAREAGGDSVLIELSPRVADAGVVLRGELRGDTVRGTWKARGYNPSVHGRFVMSRTGRNGEPRSPPAEHTS